MKKTKTIIIITYTIFCHSCFNKNDESIKLNPILFGEDLIIPESVKYVKIDSNSKADTLIKYSKRFNKLKSIFSMEPCTKGSLLIEKFSTIDSFKYYGFYSKQFFHDTFNFRDSNFKSKIIYLNLITDNNILELRKINNFPNLIELRLNLSLSLKDTNSMKSIFVFEQNKKLKKISITCSTGKNVETDHQFSF